MKLPSQADSKPGSRKGTRCPPKAPPAPSEVTDPVVAHPDERSDRVHTSVEEVNAVQDICQSETAPLRDQIRELRDNHPQPSTGGDVQPSAIVKQVAKAVAVALRPLMHNIRTNTNHVLEERSLAAGFSALQRERPLEAPTGPITEPKGYIAHQERRAQHGPPYQREKGDTLHTRHARRR